MNTISKKKLAGAFADNYFRSADDKVYVEISYFFSTCECVHFFSQTQFHSYLFQNKYIRKFCPTITACYYWNDILYLYVKSQLENYLNRAL